MNATAIDRGFGRSHRWTPIVLTLTLALLGPLARGPRAQSGTPGQWTTLPYLMPINPVHLALMNNGKVLVVSGSGNVAAETNYRVAVWDPVQGSIATQTLAWDMFCNGMVMLPDGRAFVNGGNLQYDPFHGQLRSAAFDPNVGLFTDLENMAHGRWYPTVTVLGDGRVMAFSGLSETGGTNTAVEIYTPGSGWSQEYPAGWTPPLYPRMHLLPNGAVFYSGSGRGSRLFDPAAHAWSSTIATTNYTGTRTYGTSGTASALAHRRVSCARHDLRRRQPLDADDGDHRTARGVAVVELRPADVTAAHRNECHDPAERQGSRRRRIAER